MLALWICLALALGMRRNLGKSCPISVSRSTISECIECHHFALTVTCYLDSRTGLAVSVYYYLVRFHAPQVSRGITKQPKRKTLSGRDA